MSTNQPTRTRRTANPARARAAQVCPDGVVFLTDAPHPEADRADALPFVFSVGRIAEGEKGCTAHELELVVAGIGPDRSDEDLASGLDAYARFVCRTTPTIHARLTGRAFAAFEETLR